MTSSTATRSVRSLLVIVAVAASALGAACGNPVGPREVVAAPRASVQAVEAKQDGRKSTAAKGDSASVTPAPETGAYSGGGVLPWF